MFDLMFDLLTYFINDNIGVEHMTTKYPRSSLMGIELRLTMHQYGGKYHRIMLCPC